MNPEPRRILIVEDDARIADMLDNYLQAQGWRTTLLANGLQVVPEIRRLEPALVLLDIMLPGQDGVEVCREVRRFSAVPIIMVTARVDEIDRLIGLEVGADDYVCKPFSPREVVARVKAVLRCTGGDAAPDVPEFEVDEARMRILFRGERVDLTTSEYRLLAKLVRHPGRVYSRAKLLAELHSTDVRAFDRAIDTHVKNIRKKLQAIAPDARVIRAVYGVGYQLDE